MYTATHTHTHKHTHTHTHTEGEPGTAVYDLVDGQEVDVQKVASDVARLAGNNLVVRCPNARTVAPTLQALAMAASEVKGGRLQVLPRVRYDKTMRDARSGYMRRVRLAEGLERGFRTTFVVKVVPLPGEVASQDVPASSLCRVSSSGEPGRIASAICRSMRGEAQQCGVQAVGYRAILAAFKAMVIARMRLLFPATSPQNGSQAPPPPLNFAIYPSVSQREVNGDPAAPVTCFHVLPHDLPYANEAERAEYEKKSRQMIQAEMGTSGPASDPARRRQALDSVPTIQVPVEEWAAMKKSVELLTQQNADLLSLATKALRP
ncbi:hypothetical protein DUNSADRAFT_4874 [Dunaliella salina]|uniref:Encoded protein n=1 Tax=Dunaliella salina TaxID=3046 RepID=A0ABQ7GR62_DUNSA|nr:hypothetical protein DUNSADRAFT_4874 [Dunaliella salina]|eukprot:KAF5837093.1 hypothetical protein DUNSADRAFT_4874 [Dunaliella salina]